MECPLAALIPQKCDFWAFTFNFFSNPNRTGSNRIICRIEPEFEPNSTPIVSISNSVQIRFGFGFGFEFDSVSIRVGLDSIRVRFGFDSGSIRVRFGVSIRFDSDSTQIRNFHSINYTLLKNVFKNRS